MYTDKEVRELLSLSEIGLKKIRASLRQVGVLEVRERINDEKLQLIKKIINKKNSIGSGGSWENAVNSVLDEERRERLVSAIFHENNDTLSLQIFREVLERHYNNANDIADSFFDSFVNINDILRTIGDDASADILENIQESLLNKIAFKFLYQAGKIQY